MPTPIALPDLSARPFLTICERVMLAPADVLFRAFTEQFDLWFAAPASVLMRGEVKAAFFFETHFEGAAMLITAGFCASDGDRHRTKLGHPRNEGSRDGGHG